jgi:hypothetical protein
MSRSRESGRPTRRAPVVQFSALLSLAAIIAVAGCGQGLSEPVGQTAEMQSTLFGISSTEPHQDSGDAGQVIATSAGLSQAGTVQSISIYVASGGVSGHAMLAIYDAKGPAGAPGSLMAQTNSFTLASGWNTQSVTTPVTLTAGSYYLAFELDSNSAGPVFATGTSNSNYYRSFGSYGTLPTSFGTGTSQPGIAYSEYATVNVSTCVPTTCAAQGKNCGVISNGCGGTLPSCGTCTAPQTCGAVTANVCGISGPLPPCKNTSYGNGVTCLSSALTAGGVVHYTPPAGNPAVIVANYVCGPAGTCEDDPATTLTLRDNVSGSNPESCFKPSPSSPFILSFPPQIVQQSMWVCPRIPSGVDEFTVSCSTSCMYNTITISSWTGLAASNLWDVDGSATSGARGAQNHLSISTYSSTHSTNELLFAFADDANDNTMTPGAPYSIIQQGGSFSGNPDFAALIAKPGVQTVTATWSAPDIWYGTIGAIRTAVSVP